MFAAIRLIGTLLKPRMKDSLSSFSSVKTSNKKKLKAHAKRAGIFRGVVLGIMVSAVVAIFLAILPSSPLFKILRSLVDENFFFCR